MIPERQKRKRRKEVKDENLPKKGISRKKFQKLETNIRSSDLVEPEKKKPKLCLASSDIEIELSHRSSEHSHQHFSHRSEALEKMLKLR